MYFSFGIGSVPGNGKDQSGWHCLLLGGYFGLESVISGDGVKPSLLFFSKDEQWLRAANNPHGKALSLGGHVRGSLSSVAARLCFASLKRNPMFSFDEMHPEARCEQDVITVTPLLLLLLLLLSPRNFCLGGNSVSSDCVTFACGC